MNNERDNREVWMRGPIVGVPPLLQPVAHALLQAEEDIVKYTDLLDERLLWTKPSNTASVAFHLQHIAGVIDRMFTYAKDDVLSEQQFDYLAKEGKEQPEITKQSLLNELKNTIDKAIDLLKIVNEDQLTDIRYLGRKRIQTTLIGLLFHAAEHSQRHVGQLLVTVKWLNDPFVLPVQSR